MKVLGDIGTLFQFSLGQSENGGFRRWLWMSKQILNFDLWINMLLDFFFFIAGSSSSCKPVMADERITTLLSKSSHMCRHLQIWNLWGQKISTDKLGKTQRTIMWFSHKYSWVIHRRKWNNIAHLFLFILCFWKYKYVIKKNCSFLCYTKLNIIVYNSIIHNIKLNDK